MTSSGGGDFPTTHSVLLRRKRERGKVGGPHELHFRFIVAYNYNSTAILMSVLFVTAINVDINSHMSDVMFHYTTKEI